VERRLALLRVPTGHFAAAALLTLALAGCGAKDRITAPSATVPASDSAPSWSPDGTRIAYAHSSGTEEGPDRAGIYVVDAKGGASVQILAGAYSYPDWSPDGRRLAVADHQRDYWSGGIFTVTATGDSLKKLTFIPGYDVKWSPDGGTLAFETYDAGGVYRLWLMAQDGSSPRMLNPQGSDSWFEPDWSPDGSRLAHVRSGAGIAQPEVFVMDGSGHAEERLTNDGFEARYPAWSPDGQWIAWGSWHGNTAELWLMKSDGTGAHKIANGWWPDWAPDSRHLAYTAADQWNGAYRLFTIDCLTAEIRQLTQ
jgi:TolB protein